MDFQLILQPILVKWEPVGQVFLSDTGKSWGINSFWAPEVYEVKNKYYLFYSAQWKYNPVNDLEKSLKLVLL
ncbi:MAG: family 43 glycosylhydrolase [Segetibacter sp.]